MFEREIQTTKSPARDFMLKETITRVQHGLSLIGVSAYGSLEREVRAAEKYLQDLVLNTKRTLSDLFLTKKVQVAIKSMEEDVPSYSHLATQIYHQRICQHLCDRFGKLLSEMDVRDMGWVIERLVVLGDETQLFLATSERIAHIVDEKAHETLRQARQDTIQRLAPKFDSFIRNIQSANPWEFKHCDQLARSWNGVKVIVNFLGPKDTFRVDILESLRLKSGSDIVSMLRLCVVKYFKWCSNINEKFQAALKSRDCDMLRSVLEAAQSGSKFMTQAIEWLREEHCTAILAPCFEEGYVKPIDMEDYEHMRSTLNATLSRWEKEAKQGVDLMQCPKLQTENARDKEEFFKELNGVLSLLRAAEVGVADVGQIQTSYLDTLRGSLDSVRNHLQELASQLPSANSEVNKNFNIWFDTLQSFIEHFDDERLVAKAKTMRMVLKIDLQTKIKKVVADVGSVKVEEAADKLVQAKQMMLSIPYMKGSVDRAIDGRLQAVRGQPDGPQYISDLGKALNCHRETAVGKRLINEHSEFHGYALYLRNERTLRVSHDKILKSIRGHGVDKKTLNTQFDDFNEEYWKIVDSGLEQSDAEEAITKEAIELGATVSGDDRGRLTRLVVLVFAWWTLHNSKEYQEAAALRNENEGESKSNGDLKNYLLQPHAAQVIAIFRMLGLDMNKHLFSLFASDKSAAIHNHLVQICTGEGKSLVLAVTSTVLALVGKRVDCACYSPYLSQRDYNAFMDMFEAFQVSSFIEYGTFDELCERLINRHGNLRDRVQAEILGGDSTFTRSKADSKDRILLIDEVDVFFDEGFYGSSYNPVGSLQDSTVSALLDYLWSIRGNDMKLNWGSVRQSVEYAACLKKFPRWATYLELQVKDMISALKYLPGHNDYLVIDDRIGYKVHDGVSFTRSYGYRTTFSYYKEHDNKRISET
ncbi:secA2, partial [Symbiodinium sp. KB8]